MLDELDLPVEEDIAHAIPDEFTELFEPHRYKGYYGGRGSAKSWSFARALTVKAAQTKLRVLCCREIQKSIKESVKKLLDEQAKLLKLDNFYRSIKTDIKGANGSEFIFEGLHANIDSIKSLEDIDIVWVEEAQTVSQASLDLLIPTIRKAGSELWFSWNPRHATDPVDHMFRGNSPNAKELWEPPVRSIIKKVNWDQNPWFDQGELREELERDRRRDPDKYAHIWLGEYQRNSEARVFKNWRVGSHDEFEQLERSGKITRYYFGADWGFSQDPTVLVRCFVIDNTLYVDWEAYKLGCELDHIPALFDRILGSRDYPITADSRPEIISYLRRNGFPKIKGAVKGPGSVEVGVKFLQNYDIVIHPDCTHCIDEFTMYAYVIDKQTLEVLPALADKHNHVIDSIRYAIEGTRRATPVAYIGRASRR